MQTRLREEFNNHLYPGSKILLIHSAVHLVHSESPVRTEEISYLVDELVREGYTLVFPSFTFGFCTSKRFNWLTDNSETGFLADFCWKKPASLRTTHPIYSSVILGPLRHELSRVSEETCFGNGSLFDVLFKKRARVVMLGAEWTACTFFHYCEEKVGVPYRSIKQFSGEIITRGRKDPVKTNMYVRTDRRVCNDFGELIAEIVQAKSYRASPSPWTLESVDLSEIEGISIDRLRKNPTWLLKKEVQRAVTTKQRDFRTTKFRLLLFSSGSTEFLVEDVRNAFSEYCEDLELSITPIEYWNIPALEELLDTNSHEGTFDLVVVDTGTLTVQSILEDSEGVDYRQSLKIDELIKVLRGTEGRAQIAISLLSRGDAALELVDSSSVRTIEKFEQLTAQNSRIINFVKTTSHCVAVDTDALKAKLNNESFDNRLFGLTRAHQSRPLSRALAQKACAIASAMTGRTIRLLVLDLDNTLWGGVLGEDGPDRIQLGGDFPGVLYQRFQQYLKNLSNSGMILAIASKNNHQEAIGFINSHPGMVLRESDFSATRINWRDKARNLGELAEELGIGLKNIGFVDDNPVECDRVGEELPDVRVFRIGSDPSGFISILDGSPGLEAIASDKTERTRKASYAARRKIQKDKDGHRNLKEFISALGLEIYIDKLDEFNIGRVLQILAKTNQFNSTTKRYSLSELQGECRNHFLVISSRDKYSEKETIGVLKLNAHWSDAIQSATVELWVMSCRVLGRGIEEELFSWINQKGLENRVSRIWWDYRPTDRNEPVRRVFEQLCRKPKGRYFSEPDGWKTNTLTAKIHDNFSL